MEMTRPEELIKAIIKEQSQIIGEGLAVSRAESTGAVKFIPSETNGVTLLGNTQTALEKLVNSYRVVFGQSSVDVCLDVIRRFPMAEVSPLLPESLRGKVVAKK